MNLWLLILVILPVKTQTIELDSEQLDFQGARAYESAPERPFVPISVFFCAKEKPSFTALKMHRTVFCVL